MSGGEQGALRWMQLDEMEIRAIPHIDVGECCYYYLIRKPGGFSVSAANSRIDNFKKSLERFADNPYALDYKRNEVIRFANDLANLLRGSLSTLVSTYDVALVPMNTSRPWSDEYHDPRLIDLCQMAAETCGSVRVANVMETRSLATPSHAGGSRDISTLRENLIFHGFGERVPDVAILVDDVLTTGAHYAVCRDAIRNSYPSVLVMGAFLSLHRSDYVDYANYGIEWQG